MPVLLVVWSEEVFAVAATDTAVAGAGAAGGQLWRRPHRFKSVGSFAADLAVLDLLVRRAANDGSVASFDSGD